MSRLAIIIVSYNASRDLDRCLQSLASGAPDDSEVVVVDNHSTDDSRDLVARYHGVRLIALDTNRGFAAANNVGIRATTGDLVLLLNSDTVVAPGALGTLVAALEADSSAAAAGPRLVDGNGRPELSFGSMIGPVVEWRRQRLMRALDAGDAGALAHVETMTRQRQRPDWVSGACLLVRRADAEAAGLLDERFFMYTEDVDFCASLRAQGRAILFVPECEVVHLRGRSGVANPTATREAYRRSHLAFYRKHHPALVPLVWLYDRIRGR